MKLTPTFTAALCPNELGGSCCRCVEACPAGAITLHGVPSVNASLCRNCGACASVCPSGALHHPATDTVMRRISRTPSPAPVSLRCPRVGNAPNDSFHLSTCLSALGLEVLLALAVDRRVTSIALIHGKCAGCNLGDHGAALRQSLNCAWAVISASKGVSGIADIALVGQGSNCPDNPSHEKKHSRRGFFGLLRGQLDRTKDELSKDQNSRSTHAGIGLSPKRELLSRSIRTLKASGSIPAGIQCGEITSRGSCLACGACTKICPTGALVLETGTSSCSLLFHPGRCIDCGQCIKACLRHNLSRKPARIESLGASSPITLFQGTVHRCKRCAALTAAISEDGYCPICAKKYRMDS